MTALEQLRQLVLESRLALGLTQAQLAKRANVTQGTISKFERALAEGVPFEHAERIARAVGARIQIKAKGAKGHGRGRN
jgi:transcriptional regulator with XRE-family HTH domain